MNYQFPSTQETSYQHLNSDELNQIMIAINDRRYSWACVLILRFVGYDPLHYIPQRTYSRLIKENSPILTVPTSTKEKIPENIKASVK